MFVTAIDAAWVGVVGTATGGVIGFMTSWLVQRMQRADKLRERSRAERKEAYAALLTRADDAFHLFERLAEGRISPAGIERDMETANVFYDQEVTPRYRVLKILARPEVVEGAREMRGELNAVRHIMVDAEIPPTAENSVFTTAHARYRGARDRFIELARADL